jgi:hypothetical protein
MNVHGIPYYLLCAVGVPVALGVRCGHSGWDACCLAMVSLACMAAWPLKQVRGQQVTRPARVAGGAAADRHPSNDTQCGGPIGLTHTSLGAI